MHGGLNVLSIHPSASVRDDIAGLKLAYPFTTGKLENSAGWMRGPAGATLGADAGGTVAMARDPGEIETSVWQAVLRRDRALDGKFVYAALTTGIYCRPSCPARHPHRRNTLIFKTVADAEREGFIPCRRCQPRLTSLTPAESCIKAALYYIEAHIDQKITLTSLSQVTGLSPNHLQQAFKRLVGVSPKAFCDARRLTHLKRHLKVGKSVTGASYAAGYGSSRALYENASKSLGMTPATYARGALGVRIRYAIIESPSEPVLIAVSDHGMCSFITGKNDKLLVGKLRDEFPKAVLVPERAPAEQWTAQVRAARNMDPWLLKLSHDARDWVFGARVWNAMK
jgi:AraC family transcriptional regulator of adaptative response/methylated-DNA-[protein]-cysteine methyltransferase